MLASRFRYAISTLCVTLISTGVYGSGVGVRDLFRAGNIQEIELSPNGDYVAYQQNLKVIAGNESVGYATIHHFSDNQYIYEVEWTSNNTLIVQTRSWVSGDWFMWVTRLGVLDNGDFGTLIERRHDVGGYIADPLSGSDDEIIFAKLDEKSDYYATELYRMSVFEKKTDRAFKRKFRLDTGDGELFYYLQDPAGDYTLGIRSDEGIPELWRRQPGQKHWARIWSSTTEADFLPISISSDGNSLWALSNAFTDKSAAIEFDLQTNTLRQVLYEDERFDLEGIIFDTETLLPRAIFYLEQGLVQYRFFADEAEREHKALQAQFPNKDIIVTGRSDDDSVLLVHASTSSSRGSVHICDMTADECSAVGAVAPWLDDAQLSDAIALSVSSSDDVVVDAFLTLPTAGGASIPLVAMPHGGPIGISDDRHFSAEVQWLASNGYAVLQVNYRGSSGYGRKFEAAGMRQWGRGIEDDIEASVRLVLSQHPNLDGDRVGIFGGSYGGYSALMSVIRNPQLFKCAASWAGVTDLTLIFNQSRTRLSSSLREAMIERIGSPVVDYEEQKANSPVYRYKDVKRPILLGHGTDDTIVDVEHSWRLRKLMELAGATPEFLILDDVEHGFDNVDDVAAFYEPLVAFLDKHLKR